MVEENARDWDERYRSGFYNGEIKPHGLIERFWHLIPGAFVADIAMGGGRDAVFLAKKGFSVTGLELSEEAIRIAHGSAEVENLHLGIVRGDAARLPFKRDAFHGVVVFYFLLREMVPEITAILKRGGILMYETYLKRQNKAGRRMNPSFLLDDGELLGLFSGFEPLFYEETVRKAGDRTKITARLVAKKI